MLANVWYLMVRWILIGVRQGAESHCNFLKEEIVVEIDSVRYQWSIKMIDYGLQIFYYFNLSSVLVDCVQNVKR